MKIGLGFWFCVFVVVFIYLFIYLFICSSQVGVQIIYEWHEEQDKLREKCLKGRFSERVYYSCYSRVQIIHHVEMFLIYNERVKLSIVYWYLFGSIADTIIKKWTPNIFFLWFKPTNHLLIQGPNKQKTNTLSFSFRFFVFIKNSFFHIKFIIK